MRRFDELKAELLGEPDDRDCGQPCPYHDTCHACREFWRDMVDQGLWDPANHCWTPKSIREAMK